jgi:hypothetical protein
MIHNDSNLTQKGATSPLDHEPKQVQKNIVKGPKTMDHNQPLQNPGAEDCVICA